MNRWLFKLGAFVLLGAILNVALAWGCTALMPAYPGNSQAFGWRSMDGHEFIRGWDVITRESYCAVRATAFPRRQSMLPTHASSRGLYPWWSDWSERLEMMARNPSSVSNPDENSRSFATQMFDARGWPMFALQAHWDGNDISADPTRRWQWGISLSSTTVKRSGGIVLDDLKVLPLRPVWPGFAINTLFYAGLLWLLFVAPFALRRLVRTRCGLCPACGYDLHGAAHARCPECGRPSVTCK